MPDPFRDPTHARSEALERLAARHPQAAEIREVERLSEDNLDTATGLKVGDAAPIGCLAMLAYLGTLGLAIASLLGAVPAAWVAGGVGAIFLGHAYHVLARARWKRRLAKRLAWIQERPFPVTGIRGYFAAATPMIDVVFQQAPLPATLTAGVRGHTPDAEVTQLDQRTFRIVLGDRTDERALRQFIDEVLVPVDEDLGIEEVRLGGRVAPPGRAPKEIAPGEPPQAKRP